MKPRHTKFDLEQAVGEALTVHPEASRFFSEASALLFTSDIGPMNSDRGSDAIHEFLRWRGANPTATLGACLRWITESFAVDYHTGLSSEAIIEEQLARDEDGSFEWDQQVHTLDETIIASALTQVIVEGRIDDDAMGVIAIALARAAHPLVLARSFGHGDDLRRQAVGEAKAVLEAAAARRERASAGPARPMVRISGTRIYAPSAPGGDGPPTDPERMVQEMMDGSPRPGGVRVSPAGKTHSIIAQAFFWTLWAAELDLPGFEEIYFRPTTRRPPGTYAIGEKWHACFYAEVEMGVDPTEFRRVCAGEAIAEGIELFGGAVSALAEHVDLDRRIVEAARAQLREHGLELEVLLRSVPLEGAELRAYLRLHARAKSELLVEHRGADGTRRGVVPLDEHPLLVVGDLKLVKQVVHVVPKRRSVGPVLKLPLAWMTMVSS